MSKATQTARIKLKDLEIKSKEIRKKDQKNSHRLLYYKDLLYILYIIKVKLIS